jgi:hypothetical protein
MTSAHIYHDSLRVSGTDKVDNSLKPDMCLLLLPGMADVSSLDGEVFWEEHGVGTISRFAPDSDGIERVVTSVRKWLS